MYSLWVLAKVERNDEKKGVWSARGGKKCDSMRKVVTSFTFFGFLYWKYTYWP